MTVLSCDSSCCSFSNTCRTCFFVLLLGETSSGSEALVSVPGDPFSNCLSISPTTRVTAASWNYCIHNILEISFYSFSCLIMKLKRKTLTEKKKKNEDSSSLRASSPRKSSTNWDSTLSTKMLNLSAQQCSLPIDDSIFKHKSSYVILEVQLWAILQWQDDHILNADRAFPEGLLRAVCGVHEPNSSQEWNWRYRHHINGWQNQRREKCLYIFPFVSQEDHA